MNWIILFILNKIYQNPLLLSVYRAFKYIVRITTQTTEIYRLCNSVIITNLEFEGIEEKKRWIEIESVNDIKVPTDVVFRIDKSIFHSKELIKEKEELKERSCSIQNVLSSIMLKKQFSHYSQKSPVARVLEYSLMRIYETNQLLFEIERQTSTKYDSTNEVHEKKLLQLWNYMKPDTKLESRLSKQWVEIGFQGQDPATDFRGMGIQGLNDLLYFVQTYPHHALSILQHASHPVHWYPYAIVGINITKFVYQLLESKRLQSYLFQYGTHLDSLQDFYSYLFYRFNQFWISQHLTVMDFEVKFKEFQLQIEKDLLKDTMMFKIK